MIFHPYSGKTAGFILGYFLLCISVQAQKYNQDSLVSIYQERTGYYYIKPIFGLHWSYQTEQGNIRFGKANRFDTRNQRYGLLVGYHTGRFNLEAGLTTLPVYSGYQFTSDDDFIVGGGVRVTYWQFPIHIDYILWRPTNYLRLHMLAGVAFNTERGESLLPAKTAISYSRINLTGDTSTIRSVRDTHYSTHFISTTLGLGITYQLLKRVDLSIQFNRLFSASSILQFDVQIQQNNNTAHFQTITQAGANGLSTTVGMIYHFNLTKSYRPYHKMPY